MKCRRTINDNETNTVVWFNSYGKELVFKGETYSISQAQTTINKTLLANEQTFSFTCKNTQPTYIQLRIGGQLYIRYELLEVGEQTLSGTISNLKGLTLTAFIVPRYSSAFDLSVPMTLTLDDYYKAKKIDANFSTNVDAIADTLTQKLSVLRGELWHSMNFGLPLLDKINSKALIDTAVADMVLKQDNVISILQFESHLNKNVYNCSLLIQTSFGNISISI